MTSNPEGSWQDNLIERIDAALPIDDIVGWLIHEYPSAPEQDIMTMLQRIYERDYEIGPSSDAEKKYEVGHTTWDAFPQRVARDTSEPVITRRS